MTFDCQPLSLWNLTRADWVWESHLPLGAPPRYLSRINACWISTMRLESMLCCPWRFHELFLARAPCRLWPLPVDEAVLRCFEDAVEWVGLVLAWPRPAKSTRNALPRTNCLIGKRKCITSPGGVMPEHLFTIGCSGASRMFTSNSYGRVPDRKILPAFWPRPVRTRNATSCPLLSWEVAFLKSSSLFTGCRFT